MAQFYWLNYDDCIRTYYSNFIQIKTKTVIKKPRFHLNKIVVI